MYGGEGSAGVVRPRHVGLLAVQTGLAMLAVLALALVSTARAAGPKLTPSSPVTRGSTYLALGDSVTFGYQESQVIPAPNYHQAAGFRGYPEQLGTMLHLKVTNLACPGETSASLVNAKAPSNGCEDGYRKAFPLHTNYTGSQLPAAVTFLRSHPRVRLVSLMIGANDLFLCQATTKDACTSPAEQKATLAKVSANVRRILSEIRGRAHYRGQIVIVQYFSLNYSSPVITSYSAGLNQAQASAAKPFHVRIAGAFGEFRSASRRFGQNPCLAGLLTQLGAYGNCGVHPSYAGQALLAKSVLAATRL
jgi:lysophospholipase L1-like esterase